MRRAIMRRAALSLAIIALALPLLVAAPAQALDARTWVSGAGDDANPCSRTAPCQTFAGALAKTAPGGEINCLDAGQFGPVTITFSITISCAAGTAGARNPVSGAVAIDIGADTTDVVTLRGLDLDGQGTGGVGILIISAKSVHVEKCTIRNFRFNGFSAGIFTGGSSTIFVFVADTVISDNSIGSYFTSSGGFKVASLKNVTITGSTSNGLRLDDTNVYANVTKSIISGNGGAAVLANVSSTTANIDRSTIANNTIGLEAAAGSTIRISGNNIYNNTSGFVPLTSAFIQSDSTNNTGGSNGGAGVPNAPLTKN